MRESLNKRNKITLIELMFVVGVLVILISISWTVGTKVIRAQTDQKTRAEIKMLVEAVELYKIRYGSYPANDTSESPHPLSFAETLSNTRADGSWSGKRPMYIDYKKADLKVSNDNYDASSATSTRALDPYGNTYLYYHDSVNDRFYIWSVGRDEADSSSDDFRGLSGDNDFGDDITSENL